MLRPRSAGEILENGRTPRETLSSVKVTLKRMRRPFRPVRDYSWGTNRSREILTPEQIGLERRRGYPVLLHELKRRGYL